MDTNSVDRLTPSVLGQLVGILLEDQAYLYSEIMELKFPGLHTSNFYKQDWLDSLKRLMEDHNAVA